MRNKARGFSIFSGFGSWAFFFRPITPKILTLPKISTMPENIEKYFTQVANSAAQSTLVKMTLSKPAQKHDDLRNVYVKPVLIKEKRLFAFTYHYERRDEVKNYDVEQMLDILHEMIPNRFLNAVLFTVSEDVTLLVSSKGKATIQTKKVQECREQNLEHDKQKARFINPANWA